MTTRRTVSRTMPVAFLFVVAAGFAASCHLGKKDELEDRPLPEPLPVVDAGKAATKTLASPVSNTASAARPASNESRTPTQPASSQPASTSQAHEPPSAAATITATPTASSTTTPAEAGTPPPTTPAVPNALPAQMTQCLDKCQAVLRNCLKRLTQPDAGASAADTMASCAKAESDCRAACL